MWFLSLKYSGAVFGYDVADGDTISERETTRFTHVTDFVYGGMYISSYKNFLHV